ncbi:MAG: hypothetical protein II968_00445 [Selenomonadaceae bacterium]|nr:hypothetical protein [Selenomonadaceae bacterium]
MADIIKTRNTIQVVAEFSDGDDRTITFDNPKAALTEAQLAAQINEASAYAKAHQVILGDKIGAEFTRFKTARKVSGTTKYLDLTD